jgi:hypothetical protein
MSPPLLVDSSPGIADPLDSRLGQPVPTKARGRWGLRKRLALGLSPIPSPWLVLLPLGMALGPQGLGVLSEPVLASLDPAIVAALAALGILVGLALQVRPPRELGRLGLASFESTATAAMVFGGVAVFEAFRPDPSAMPLLVALALAICAAPSATPTGQASSPQALIAGRLGDLDDFVPILAGGLLLAWWREPAPAGTAWLLGQNALIALTVAVAGWLLVTQTPSESEQRVFAIGTVLLVGGAAAHLSGSALFAGLIAGMFWASTRVGHERIARDLPYLQHSLIVLLLIVAGARVVPSVTAAALVAVYMACRITGKVLGGSMVSLANRQALPADLGLYLVSPGIVGVAFALNLLHANGDWEGAPLVLSVVAAGSIGSELLALLFRHAEETR